MTCCSFPGLFLKVSMDMLEKSTGCRPKLYNVVSTESCNGCIMYKQEEAM